MKARYGVAYIHTSANPRTSRRLYRTMLITSTWYEALPVGFPSIVYPNLRIITRALNIRGIPTSSKPASGDALGLLWIPNTLDVQSGTRCHPRVAYYDPVAHRPNLHLLTGEEVLEVLFEPQNLTAIGVEIMSRRDGVVRKAYAAKEVILAPGAVSTPKFCN